MISLKHKERINRDIYLANALQMKLDSIKSVVILDSGYGIDAVTKGKITRLHHDLDLFLLVRNLKLKYTKKSIAKELSKLDQSTWKSNPTKKSWVWLREKEKPESARPRQINIHLLKLIENRIDRGYFLVESSAGVRYKLYAKRSTLSDFIGKSYFFTTLIPEEYLANKIRLIPKYSANWNIREKDINDFKKLFSVKNIDLEKTTNLLKEFLNNTHSKNTSSYYWLRMIKKYPDVMSKRQLTFLKTYFNFVS